MCCHVARKYVSGRTRCLVCGNDFQMNRLHKTVVCPHCKSKLKVTDDKKQKYEDMEYYTHFESIKDDIQTVRIFQVFIYQHTIRKPTYNFMEVARFWFSERGFAIESRKLKPFELCYFDVFRSDEPIALSSLKWNIDRIIELIKQRNQPINMSDVCKSIRMRLPDTSLISKIGWRKLFPDIFIPGVETLLKMGMKGEILYEELGAAFIKKNWPSIKIALRHGFAFDDPSLWMDTIELMKKFKMDIRNPQLIATPRFREIHDNLDKRIKRTEAERRRLEEIQKQEERIRQAKQWENEYVRMKEKYFNLSFYGKEHDILIQPLKSVEEFVVHGQKQHICVATMEYYKKKDSLILSATHDDLILATIEVSLKDYKIIQCRGRHNKVPEYNDYIQEIIMRNMNKIRACA